MQDKPFNPEETSGLEQEVNGRRKIVDSIQKTSKEALTKVMASKRTYQTLEDLMVNGGKCLGVTVAAWATGGAVNYFLAQLGGPLMGYIGEAAGSITAGLVGWNLSNKIFSDSRKFIPKGFEFLSKWIAGSAMAAGAIIGTARIMDYSIGNLVMGELKPDYLKGLINNGAAWMYAAVPTGLVAGLSAFGNINVSSMLKKAAEIAYKYKHALMLAGATAAAYFGSDYLMNLSGTSLEKARFVNQGAALATLYASSNYIKSKAARTAIKLGALAYGSKLAGDTGMAEALGIKNQYALITAKILAPLVIFGSVSHLAKKIIRPDYLGKESKAAKH